MNQSIKAPETPLLSLLQWSQTYLEQAITNTVPLSGDAGFRRYFRVETQAGSAIAVFAPPALEKNAEFVQMAAVLAQHGIAAPVVLAVDFDQGYMLLSDLGDQQLMPLLNTPAADHWYKAALKGVIHLQTIPQVDVCQLPTYNRDVLGREMQLFYEWFVTKLLGVVWTTDAQQVFDEMAAVLIQDAESQPQAVVHRDYHCRNLMVDHDTLAMIDFQDALWGPVFYDVASLLKDCYIHWPREQMLSWLQYYLSTRQTAPAVPFNTAVKHVDFIGLQRHIKVLGIFARLHLRDGKSGYLKDLPRVIEYVRDVLTLYPELTPFKVWFDAEVCPAITQQPWSRV